MAKMFRLVCALALGFGLVGCNNIKTEKVYWSDGKTLKLEYSYKKAKTHLSYRLCDASDVLPIKILGKAKCYHKNGQLSHEVEFVDDGKGGSMKVGIEKTYYDNGQIKEERPYNDKGEKDGIAKVWGKNGDLLMQVSYKNGKKDGLTTIWWEENDIPKAIEIQEIPKESDKVDTEDYDDLLKERGRYLDDYYRKKLPNYREL